MFLNLSRRRLKKKNPIQEEYVALLKTALQSPLWDGSDEQLYLYFPKDLTPETIAYAKEQMTHQPAPEGHTLK